MDHAGGRSVSEGTQRSFLILTFARRKIAGRNFKQHSQQIPMSTKVEATIEDLYKVEGKAELVNGEIVLIPGAG